MRSSRMFRRLRRRRWSLAAIAVLALVGLAVLLLAQDDDLRAGSELLEPGPVAVASRTPVSYRIVYRVESRAAGELTVSTDRLTVLRPFSARRETLSGEPPGTGEIGVQVSAFARLKSRDTVLAVPPGPSPPDRRPDAFLEEALREGYAAERERRRVAGRVCRVYRLAGDPGATSLDRIHDDLEDFTDVCVDEAGLVLEEILFFGGEMLSRSLAVEVAEGVDADGDDFAVGDPTLQTRDGGGSVRPITSDSRPPGQDFWEPSSPPVGFEHRGRFAVVPPQFGFDDPLQRGRIIAGVSDVWVRGVDVLVVEQGGTTEGRRPFDADPRAMHVVAGELGEAELAFGLRSSEVRTVLGGGRYVRVYGTLAPSELLEVARRLGRNVGGTLIYLDEGPSETS